MLHHRVVRITLSALFCIHGRAIIPNQRARTLGNWRSPHGHFSVAPLENPKYTVYMVRLVLELWFKKKRLTSQQIYYDLTFQWCSCYHGCFKPSPSSNMFFMKTGLYSFLVWAFLVWKKCPLHIYMLKPYLLLKHWGSTHPILKVTHTRPSEHSVRLTATQDTRNPFHQRTSNSAYYLIQETEKKDM